MINRLLFVLQGLKDPETKRKLWPILLGVLEPDMTDEAVHEAMDAYQGAYQQVGSERWPGVKMGSNK